MSCGLYKGKIMATAFYSHAINKLGNWNYKLNGEDLSTLIFYDDNGNEIQDQVI